MPLSNNIRHNFFLALITLLILAHNASVSFAQKSAGTSTDTKTTVSPYKRMAGTTHTRAARTYDVVSYTIRTRFDVNNKTVIGDEVITLKPLGPNFRTIELDAADMKIESVILNETQTALNWQLPPDKLSITLDRAYEPTESISVRIRYRATPRRGLYFVPSSGGPGLLNRPAQIWTQGEPEDNHHWFACYDFPDDKATSEQYITTPANQLAISNGTLVETINNVDGTHTFHWKMEQPHSSYLVSLVVGDYVRLSDTYGNIPVEYYTYHGTEQIAQRAFAKTPQMMRWFSQELGYEYPYNRYAQTIVSYFIFGGMENITATTQADSEILEGGISETSNDSTENLISHELAHSWFGNLVTCKDWSQAWLNEGFATFMESSFKEHEGGREAYLKEMRENARLYFNEDHSQYRRPLVYNRYRVPIDLFDATLYKKGALVLHMLRETVGDEMFWTALHKYLDENQYRNVETADLERAFEETTGKKLDWFFDQWVYKAGYPELRVRYNYNPSTRQLALTVAQTQTPDATTPAAFRLPVDVEITTAKGKRTERIEITQRQQRFVLQSDSQPLKLNFDKGSRLLMKVQLPQHGIDDRP